MSACRGGEKGLFLFEPFEIRELTPGLRPDAGPAGSFEPALGGPSRERGRGSGPPGRQNSRGFATAGTANVIVQVIRKYTARPANGANENPNCMKQMQCPVRCAPNSDRFGASAVRLDGKRSGLDGVGPERRRVSGARLGRCRPTRLQNAGANTRAYAHKVPFEQANCAEYWTRA